MTLPEYKHISSMICAAKDVDRDDMAKKFLSDFDPKYIMDMYVLSCDGFRVLFEDIGGCKQMLKTLLKGRRYNDEDIEEIVRQAESPLSIAIPTHLTDAIMKCYGEYEGELMTYVKDHDLLPGMFVKYVLQTQ